MKISTSADLDLAIADLERRRVIQETILKEQFHDTVEHFKPKNLFKAAVHKVTEPGSVGSTILKAGVGLALGMLTKKIVLGKSTSLIGKLASNGMKIGITNAVLSNTDKISAWGKAIYHNLIEKKANKPDIKINNTAS